MAASNLEGQSESLLLKPTWEKWGVWAIEHRPDWKAKFPMADTGVLVVYGPLPKKKATTLPGRGKEGRRSREKDGRLRGHSSI